MRRGVALAATDRELQIGPIACVLEDLPGPEDTLAESESVLTELLPRRQAFGVRGEIALEVSPAELAARERQVRVGPPAIEGHDRLRLAK